MPSCRLPSCNAFSSLWPSAIILEALLLSCNLYRSACCRNDSTIASEEVCASSFTLFTVLLICCCCSSLQLRACWSTQSGQIGPLWHSVQFSMHILHCFWWQRMHETKCRLSMISVHIRQLHRSSSGPFACRPPWRGCRDLWRWRWCLSPCVPKQALVQPSVLHRWLIHLRQGLLSNSLHPSNFRCRAESARQTSWDLQWIHWSMEV